MNQFGLEVVKTSYSRLLNYELDEIDSFQAEASYYLFAPYHCSHSESDSRPAVDVDRSCM